MAGSRLAEAHIEAQRRLRVLAVAGTERIWRALPGYDEQNVDEWLFGVVPLVRAAQSRSVSLTDAFLARAMGRAPLGIDPSMVVAGLRNGTPPEEVYHRPFVQLWSMLKDGKPYADAVLAGEARAASSAAMDTQLAMRGAANAVQEADDNIFGYQRVADGGACQFCQEVDGAYVKSADAMPLHNRCIVGDSIVWTPQPLAATCRRYEGEIVTLKTAASHELTVTPNHPVLTDRGWVPAELLREGDRVVSSRRLDGVCGGVPHEENMPARIEDHFRSGRVGAFERVPFAAEQFHGDRGDTEVDVVALDGGLDAWALAALLEPREHALFTERVELATGLSCDCGRRHRRLRGRMATLSRMSGRNSASSFGSALSGCRDAVLLAGRSLGDPCLSQMAIDHVSAGPVAPGDGQHRFATLVGHDCVGERDLSPGSGGIARTDDSAALKLAGQGVFADTDGGRGLRDRLAGEVSRDTIVQYSRCDWRGDVYNLVTKGGWFTANGIVTHNCGCGLDPLTRPHPRAAKLPSGVAVHQHGELGPVLTDPAHEFTTEAQALG